MLLSPLLLVAGTHLQSLLSPLWTVQVSLLFLTLCSDSHCWWVLPAGTKTCFISLLRKHVKLFFFFFVFPQPQTKANSEPPCALVTVTYSPFLSSASWKSIYISCPSFLTAQASVAHLWCPLSPLKLCCKSQVILRHPACQIPAPVFIHQIVCLNSLWWLSLLFLFFLVF